jgi:hypothetical protein
MKFCLLIQIPLDNLNLPDPICPAFEGERVLFHYFEQFVAEYEYRYGREYGCFFPIVQEVVEKHLDYSNPKNGFARIWYSECGTEMFLP